VANDDPALKYIPNRNDRINSKASRRPTDVKHGAFTTVAYATAWSVVVLGTLIGLLIILQAFDVNRFGGSNRPDIGMLIGGIGIIAGSWIGASGVGTLAEISRKLTKTQ